MKYYAKLMYNGNTVGYRYEHKGKFYDIGHEKKKEFGIKETNYTNLKMIAVGNDVMTEAERDGVVVEDLTNKKEVFDALIEEDRLEEENKAEALKSIAETSINNNDAPKVTHQELSEIEKGNKVIATGGEVTDTPITTHVGKTSEVPKKLELSVKPTKKKVVTSKGVGLLIVGEEETLVPQVGSATSDFLVIVTVTSKTAIAKINGILGAKFNKDARGKDFDKGKKEFKLKLGRHQIEELKATFGLIPCLSTKQGWRYTLLTYRSDEKVFNSKIRLTDFAVPKGTDDTLVGGEDNKITFSEYRDDIFNKIEDGSYILLADL